MAPPDLLAYHGQATVADLVDASAALVGVLFSP